MANCTWQSADGAQYTFTVYGIDTQWNPVGGVYIFAKAISATQWQAIYIGQSENLQQRHANHPQYDPAVQLGATHIHALVVPHEKTRLAIEAALILNCDPPLNSQGLLGGMRRRT